MVKFGVNSDDMDVEEIEESSPYNNALLNVISPTQSGGYPQNAPLQIIRDETSAKAAAENFNIYRPPQTTDSNSSFRTPSGPLEKADKINLLEALRRPAEKNGTGSGSVGVPRKPLSNLDIYDNMDYDVLSSAKSPVQHMSELGELGSASMSIDEKDQRRARFDEQPVRKGLRDATLDLERRTLANVEAALIKREGERIAAAEIKQKAKEAEAKRKEDDEQALRVIRENAVRVKSGSLFEGNVQRPQFARRVAYKPRQGAVVQAPRLPKRVVPKGVAPKKAKAVKGTKKGVKPKKVKPKKKQ
jgi:hypothetical protein